MSLKSWPQIFIFIALGNKARFQFHKKFVVLQMVFRDKWYIAYTFWKCKCLLVDLFRCRMVTFRQYQYSLQPFS